MAPKAQHEKMALQDVLEGIERTRAAMRTAAQLEDYGRAQELKVELERLTKLASASGAASSQAGPSQQPDLEDVTEANLQTKRAREAAERANAIDLTLIDDEPPPTSGAAPQQQPCAPSAASKKPRLAPLAGSAAPGPLPKSAHNLRELPQKCSDTTPETWTHPDNRGAHYYPVSAVYAGHVTLRLRAARPCVLPPNGGQIRTTWPGEEDTILMTSSSCISIRP